MANAPPDTSRFPAVCKCHAKFGYLAAFLAHLKRCASLQEQRWIPFTLEPSSKTHRRAFGPAISSLPPELLSLRIYFHAAAQPIILLSEVQTSMCKLLEQLASERQCKAFLAAHVESAKTESPEKQVQFLRSRTRQILGSVEVGEHLDRMIGDLTTEIDLSVTNGSGWAIERTLFIALEIALYDVLPVGKPVQLPPEINPQAVIDCHSPPGQCFAYALFANLFLRKEKNPTDPAHYTQIELHLKRSKLGRLPKYEEMRDIPVRSIIAFLKRNKLRSVIYRYVPRRGLLPIHYEELGAGPDNQKNMLCFLIIDNHIMAVKNPNQLITGLKCAERARVGKPAFKKQKTEAEAQASTSTGKSLSNYPESSDESASEEYLTTSEEEESELQLEEEDEEEQEEEY